MITVIVYDEACLYMQALKRLYEYEDMIKLSLPQRLSAL